MPSPGIILLHLSGPLQAEEHASCARVSLGDRTSPMRAACLAVSAGATRENSTLILGFSSRKKLELCLDFSAVTQDAWDPSWGIMWGASSDAGVISQDGFRTVLCTVPRGGASPCLVMSAAGAKSWARSQVCDPCQKGRDLESKAELLLSERWTEILSKTTECSLFLPVPYLSSFFPKYMGGHRMDLLGNRRAVLLRHICTIAPLQGAGGLVFFSVLFCCGFFFFPFNPAPGIAGSSPSLLLLM